MDHRVYTIIIVVVFLTEILRGYDTNEYHLKMSSMLNLYSVTDPDRQIRGDPVIQSLR